MFSCDLSAIKNDSLLKYSYRLPTKNDKQKESVQAPIQHCNASSILASAVAQRNRLNVCWTKITTTTKHLKCLCKKEKNKQKPSRSKVKRTPDCIRPRSSPCIWCKGPISSRARLIGPNARWYRPSHSVVADIETATFALRRKHARHIPWPQESD